MRLLVSQPNGFSLTMGHRRRGHAIVFFHTQHKDPDKVELGHDVSCPWWGSLHNYVYRAICVASRQGALYNELLLSLVGFFATFGSPIMLGDIFPLGLPFVSETATAFFGCRSC